MKKKKEDMYDNDFDRWGTTPGATYSLDDVDEIEEVDKGIDHIEEIEKFNPFHDGRGRFSSSRGMSTYSANPKTKAGQMAIARSTAAGYGSVMNVHRESKGENIRQNDIWVKSGQKPSPSQMARAQANAPKTVSQMRQNAHTNRVKGTNGATETATARHPSRANTKQQQNQQSQQQNQTQQQSQQTNAQGLQAATANVQLASTFKLAIQPRNGSGQAATTKKVCNDHDQERVKGKDISNTFDTNAGGSGRAVDKVAKAQGWDKDPTVTNDLETFQKAAVKSGRLFFRSVDGNGQMSGDAICSSIMGDGKSPLGGNGGKVYGGGLYTVGANIDKTGRPLGHQIAGSQNHSFAYGQKQIMATVHPDANIASPTKARSLQRQFNNMSSSDRSRFGGDIGAYIASKGYDGAQWHDRSDPYITMYNKSAMIFFGGVATR